MRQSTRLLEHFVAILVSTVFVEDFLNGDLLDTLFTTINLSILMQL
jgi:hypothetical protein